MRATARAWRQRSFSPLTRRILAVNLIGLGLFAGGALYLNQFRSGLIEARISSLTTQAEIIAAAIAQTSVRGPGSNQLNSMLAAQMLRRLVVPGKNRARLFNAEGQLIVDSRDLMATPAPVRVERLQAVRSKDVASMLEQLYAQLINVLPTEHRQLYRELNFPRANEYAEVLLALNGKSASTVRVNSQGEPILSVAVPVQRFKIGLGGLMVTAEAGDIDEIVRAERRAILQIFIVAVALAVVMSVVMAGAIVRPLRRLAQAAENVRDRREGRTGIPDFTSRSDEIGDLSGILADMTASLHDRIDTIERFSADVAHEIKNPLTSISSAVEILPQVTDTAQRDKPIAIIADDVKRLDRLISDISTASRLDAQLSRATMEPVELIPLLNGLVDVFRETRKSGPSFMLEINTQHNSPDKFPDKFIVRGEAGRISQVMRNLLENAASFSPPDGVIRVTVDRTGGEVIICVEDQGIGIPEENLETIFERFYTQRPQGEAFGKHSGLGLSISRQIVEAYGGHIRAENRYADDKAINGARFIVTFQAMP